jgi:dienelactone hydrolase
MIMRTMLGLATAFSLVACAARPTAPARSSVVLDEHDYASQEVLEPYVAYASRSAAFRTRLEGPTPAPEPIEASPAGAREVRYPSEVGALRAWYARPAGSDGKRLPVVVYLHNDFALRAEAWNNARPFVDAGYALLVPGLRGEDGGPGERELLLGEVHDARAAVAWARAQTDHAPECVNVLGHSIGGGVAALLSLRPDAGVRRTASVGGIYRAHTFHAWRERESIRGIVRFDVSDPREISMRLLLPNVRDLAVPHIAYAGTDDDFDDRYAALAAERARSVGAPLEHVRVAGDHMSSIDGAVRDFLVRMRDDGTECSPAR